jgi:hypothetical protein
MPAFAQTKETVDPQTKVQLDGLTQKFAKALDSNDASQQEGFWSAVEVRDGDTWKPSRLDL